MPFKLLHPQFHLVEVNPTADGQTTHVSSFTDWDISGTVGKQRALVLFNIEVTGDGTNGDTVELRPNGVTDEQQTTTWVGPTAAVTWRTTEWCFTDGAGVIEYNTTAQAGTETFAISVVAYLGLGGLKG